MVIVLRRQSSVPVTIEGVRQEVSVLMNYEVIEILLFLLLLQVWRYDPGKLDHQIHQSNGSNTISTNIIQDTFGV